MYGRAPLYQHYYEYLYTRLSGKLEFGDGCKPWFPAVSGLFTGKP